MCLVAALGTHEMENFDDEAGVSRSTETALPELPGARATPCVPYINASGRVRPISAKEQARKAKAVAALVELMLAMPDEDPSGAWEEAMRDLDAHRPHRKLFEGLY
jgi:hypothetical protein